MTEHFERFDPSRMAPEDYLDYMNPSETHFDLRVVSVLGAAFTPLIETFSERVEPLINPESLDALPLSNGPIQVMTQGEKKPHMSFLDKPYKPKEFFERLYSDPGKDLSSIDIHIPVGQYGREFAAANMNTTRALFTLVDQTIGEDCFETARTFTDVILRDTFQRDPLKSFKEGIHTTSGLISILTAEQIPGYEDDPLRLTQDIVRDGIMHWFAASAANGRINPFVAGGLYFRNPLLVEEGKLTIRPGLKQMIHEERKHALRRASMGERGRGCPVAHKTVEVFSEGEMKKTSGVEILGEIYLQVLEQYMQRDNPISEPQHLTPPHK